jgi:4-amino-4-deoxy-L-arabinose transferase-like glycosyltransferase
MLFILAAIYFTLRWLDSKRAIHLFAAGLAVGMVAVFKQNVGVYAGVALALSYVLNTRGLPRSFKEAKQIYLDSWKNGGARMHLAAGLGFILPLAAMAIYLLSHRALGAALRVFLKGPGEHLQMKFTGYPLPKYAGLIFIAAAIAIAVASRFARRKPGLARAINIAVIGGALVCALFAPQAAIDNTIFWFAPALFTYAAWRYLRNSRDTESEFADGQRARGVLLVLLMFALASFGEVFPRSVRGLLIGTMPPAFILMAFLFARNFPINRKPESEPAPPTKQAASTQRLALAVAAVVLAAFALRTILPHYVHFDAARGLRFRADTELGFDRGRGIYLPGKRVEEVTAMVVGIQSRVEPGGYFFAHALDATSYYFLADRNSPTGATLWNDAGTNNAERARTVAALQDKQVRLVLTSEQAMLNERYQPLVDLLKNDFHPTETIGKVIFLERNN